MTIIVDTNVALVANRKSEQASEVCEQACIDRILEITSGEVKLALDDERRIIEEYRNKLNPDGQPGVGDEFLKWVEINWTNEERCDRVSITLIEASETKFKEFPDDPALQNFDPDDRKFVAVACAHSERPPILQAVDSAWWDFREAFSRHGVKVKFICRDDIHRLRIGAPA